MERREPGSRGARAGGAASRRAPPPPAPPPAGPALPASPGRSAPLPRGSRAAAPPPPSLPAPRRALTPWAGGALTPRAARDPAACARSAARAGPPAARRALLGHRPRPPAPAPAPAPGAARTSTAIRGPAEAAGPTLRGRRRRLPARRALARRRRTKRGVLPPGGRRTRSPAPPARPRACRSGADPAGRAPARARAGLGSDPRPAVSLGGRPRAGGGGACARVTAVSEGMPLCEFS
ncbi:uncharacterized protein [Vulpes vulpes]|uniref:Basic proline-rich protein-like n=1 Tax=Vulpes vulpes TaxID=9627 RepID=A0ABM4YHN2_VULVU